MPLISLFFGIRITMYYNDHMPPHFHVSYADETALIDIHKMFACCEEACLIDSYGWSWRGAPFIRMNSCRTGNWHVTKSL